MSRLYGADIILKLEDILKENYNLKLAEVAVERADTGLEPVTKFHAGYLERQYPECLITLADSTLVGVQLTMDMAQEPEEYPVDVIVTLKDNTDLTYLRQEYYIEALQKVLHGYNDEDVSWVLVKNTIRANMYTAQKETLRVVGVSLIIRIL